VIETFYLDNTVMDIKLSEQASRITAFITVAKQESPTFYG